MKDLFGSKPYDAIITIPNFITITGILLLIPYIWTFLTNDNRWIMLGSLFLAGCSDLFDGLCARWLKQKSRIGEIIDPLRDRLILGTVLLNILYLGGIRLVGWIGVIITYEIAIALINYSRGVKASVHLAGKLRQMAHLLVCGCFIINYYFKDIVTCLTGFNLNFPAKFALTLIALFSLISLLTYSLLYFKNIWLDTQI